jgi:hypothetical protein
MATEKTAGWARLHADASAWYRCATESRVSDRKQLILPCRREDRRAGQDKAQELKKKKSQRLRKID